MHNSGIYQIINNTNNHRYIGSAVDLRRRKYNHLYFLRKNIHQNQYLQNAWNKYGEEAFEFKVIGMCLSERERLLELEQEAINHLKPEYNICRIAGSGIGLTHTEEARQKISQTHKGKKKSEEHKQKIGQSVKNIMSSPEMIQKLLKIHEEKKILTKQKRKSARIEKEKLKDAVSYSPRKLHTDNKRIYWPKHPIASPLGYVALYKLKQWQEEMGLGEHKI